MVAMDTKEEIDMQKGKMQDLLPNRIKQLCKEKGLTYYGLSYKSTIPLTTLIHITDGSTKNPGIITIMKICDGLGITLKEFFDTSEFDEAMKDCE